MWHPQLGKGDSYASWKGCKIKWPKRCSVLFFLRVVSAAVSYHLFRGLKLFVWHAGRWVLVLCTSSIWWTSRSGSWELCHLFLTLLNMANTSVYTTAESVQRSGFFSFPYFRVTSVVFVLPPGSTAYLFPTLDRSRYLFHSDLNICVCCVPPL